MLRTQIALKKLHPLAPQSPTIRPANTSSKYYPSAKTSMDFASNRVGQVSELLKADKESQRKSLGRDVSSAYESEDNAELYYYPSFLAMSQLPNKNAERSSLPPGNVQPKHSFSFRTPSSKAMSRHFVSIYRNVIVKDTPKDVQEVCSSVYKSKHHTLTIVLELNSGKPQGESQQHRTSGKTPFLALGLPPSRKQVEKLDEWLREVAGKIERAGSERSEKCSQLLTVHQFCLLEIVRQVSVQCVERGEFLQRLINRYTELVIE